MDRTGIACVDLHGQYKIWTADCRLWTTDWVWNTDLRIKRGLFLSGVIQCWIIKLFKVVAWFWMISSALISWSSYVELRLQYTFGSAMFFKCGVLGQSGGRGIISNFWKNFLIKAEYWRRNGGFTFSPEVKVYLLTDSPMARKQSTETIFAGITSMDITNPPWEKRWRQVHLPIVLSAQKP